MESQKTWEQICWEGKKSEALLLWYNKKLLETPFKLWCKLVEEKTFLDERQQCLHMYCDNKANSTGSILKVGLSTSGQKSGQEKWFYRELFQHIKIQQYFVKFGPFFAQILC